MSSFERYAYRKAMAHIRNRSYHQAMQWFRVAVRDGTDEVFLSAGLCAFLTGDAEAVDWLERSKTPRAAYFLSLAHYRNANFEQAKKVLEESEMTESVLYKMIERSVQD